MITLPDLILLIVKQVSVPLSKYRSKAKEIIAQRHGEHSENKILSAYKKLYV